MLSSISETELDAIGTNTKPVINTDTESSPISPPLQCLEDMYGFDIVKEVFILDQYAYLHRTYRCFC
jgi:hypothetical protein